MSVANPNALIFKLTSINALMASAVRVYNLTTLHHEFRDHSLNLSPFVEQVLTKLSSAESPKVFACLWQVLVEQLNHDAMFLVPNFSRLSDLNVHPALNVLLVKGWHRSKTIFELNNFFRVEA